MRVKQLAIAALTVLLTATSAMAAERYTLRYPDRAFSNGDVIQLKTALERNYRNLDLRDAELIRITVLAKSRHGQGQIHFVTDGRIYESARLDGTLRSWNNSSPRSFERVNLLLRPLRYGGTWQLKISGNIKIRAISIELEEARGSGGGVGALSFTRIGTANTGRILADGDTFRVNRNADAIMIRVTDEDIVITSAVAYFSNGSTQRLNGLIGSFREGQQAVARIQGRGRMVQAVRIYARTLNVFAGHGNYDVLVGMRR